MKELKYQQLLEKLKNEKSSFYKRGYIEIFYKMLVTKNIKINNKQQYIATCYNEINNLLEKSKKDRFKFPDLIKKNEELQSAMIVLYVTYSLKSFDFLQKLIFLFEMINYKSSNFLKVEHDILFFFIYKILYQLMIIGTLRSYSDNFQSILDVLNIKNIESFFECPSFITSVSNIQ